MSSFPERGRISNNAYLLELGVSSCWWALMMNVVSERSWWWCLAGGISQETKIRWRCSKFQLFLLLGLLRPTGELGLLLLHTHAGVIHVEDSTTEDDANTTRDKTP